MVWDKIRTCLAFTAYNLPDLPVSLAPAMLGIAGVKDGNGRNLLKRHQQVLPE
jgi:hypothetical protein